MAEENNINPVFLSTATAREIYDLGEVEKVRACLRANNCMAVEAVVQDINKLLQLASSCVSLLTIPELDPPEEGKEPANRGSPSSVASTPREPTATSSRPRLPVGEERAEQFVLEATQYYETLDVSACTAHMYYVHSPPLRRFT